MIKIILRYLAPVYLVGSFLLAAMGSAQAAASDFTIEDIELVGAQRITLPTVLNYIPAQLGDTLTPDLMRRTLQSLYRTGFFKDISLARRDNILIIKVKERPAIAEINITGNKKLKDDDIQKAFADAELVRGRIYNDQVLDIMQKELERLYYSIGRYGLKMETLVTPLPRNRVKIDVEIREGLTAKIRQVTIVGNDSFSEKKLLAELQSGIPKWYAFFSKRDEYAKTKLSGDLEALNSFYLDRGYLRFAIESTQVTISPDKKDIYITINIREGEQYKVRSLAIEGQTIVPRYQILQIAEINNIVGEYFSNANATRTIDQINQLLGTQGYAFADTRLQPKIDDASKEVDLTFFVQPNKRIYVRRIALEGNQKTLDRVYRQEVRQMEGTWYNKSAVERSKVRLERLPFVEKVELEAPLVPGMEDQVDVIYKITERFAGSFNIGAGYSGDDGLAFSAGLTQSNLFGTGNSLSFSANVSEVVDSFNISYRTPYFTQDGVSRTISLFFREVNTEETLLTSYIFNNRGASVDFGIPISEYSVLRAGGGISNIKIELANAAQTSVEIQSFINEYGDDYDQFNSNLAYIYDTRNRTIFPDRGSRHVLSLELPLPLSDLEFAKLNYQPEQYIPVTSNTTLLLRGEVGYGFGYGELDELPFFEKYIAGGIRSLRGFESRSIGPKETIILTDANGNPVAAEGDTLGGDLLTVGSIEYILPGLGQTNSARFSLFYDFGNVYAEPKDFDISEFRSSVGVSVRWLAPIGAFIFSYAEPIRKFSGDEIERFQFTVGGSF